MRTVWLGVLAALGVWLPVQAADMPAGTTITLASTASVDNSGLLAAILPRFTKTTGIGVRQVAWEECEAQA